MISEDLMRTMRPKVQSSAKANILGDFPSAEVLLDKVIGIVMVRGGKYPME